MSYQRWLSQHLSPRNIQELAATLTGIITEGSVTPRKEMLLREPEGIHDRAAPIPTQLTLALTFTHVHYGAVTTSLPVLKSAALNYQVTSTSSGSSRKGTGKPLPTDSLCLPYPSWVLALCSPVLQPRESGHWQARSSSEPKRSGRTGTGTAPE